LRPSSFVVRKANIVLERLVFMSKNREGLKSILRSLEGFFEVLLLALIYYYVWNYYLTILQVNIFGHRGKYVLVGVYYLMTYALFYTCDSLSYGNLKAIDTAISQWISLVIVNFITYFQISLIANGMVSAVPMIQLTLAQIVVASICVVIFTRLHHHFGSPASILLIYGTDNAMSIVDKMDKKGEEYRITETIEADKGYDEIVNAINNHDCVLINDVEAKLRNDILKYCFKNDIRTYLVPKISDVFVESAEPITLFDTPLRLVGGKSITTVESAIKRCFDILLSIIIMIPGSVMMLIIAILIKLEDKGPIFYRQKRVTLNDREFDMLKFRSMIPDAEKYTGAVLAEEDDPRITKVGKILRACRLDELPQFINIIKGDMSIVGPRPERRYLIEEYTKEMPEFAFRTKVRGGLTGYAQVYGKYNTTAYDKLKFDLMYIENYSLLLDFKLVLMTPQIMFRKEATEGVER